MKTLHAVGISQSTYDPFQELAVAVSRQAAADYRYLAKRLHGSGSPWEKMRMENEMQSIRHFFLSEWCCSLSGGDHGPLILEALDKEVFGG